MNAHLVKNKVNIFGKMYKAKRYTQKSLKRIIQSTSDIRDSDIRDSDIRDFRL